MKLGMINGETPDCFDYAKSKHLDFIEICRNYDEETLKFIDNVASVKESFRKMLENGVYKADLFSDLL